MECYKHLCTSFYVSMFSVLLVICLRMEFLIHVVILCLPFEETEKPFSTATAPFHIPTSSYSGFQLFPFPTTLVIVCLLTLAILVNVKWYLTVVLSYIFLMNDDFFFMCLLDIYLCSLEKCLFKPFAHLKLSCVFSVVRALYIFQI